MVLIQGSSAWYEWGQVGGKIGDCLVDRIDNGLQEWICRVII